MSKNNRIQTAVDYLISEGLANTTSSNWCISFDEVPSFTPELLEDVLSELENRDEILEVQIIDNEFDMVYGTLFCISYTAWDDEETVANYLVELLGGADVRYFVIRTDTPYSHLFSFLAKTSPTSLQSSVSLESAMKESKEFPQLTSLQQSAMNTLMKQFGNTAQFAGLLSVDLDYSIVQVEQNFPYFQENHLPIPFDFSLSIGDGVNCYQRAANLKTSHLTNKNYNATESLLSNMIQNRLVDLAQIDSEILAQSESTPDLSM